MVNIEEEYIVIEVINDKFSMSERSQLEQCVKDIEQGRLTKTNRYIIMSGKKVDSNEKIIISISNGTLFINELRKIAQIIRDIEQNKPTRLIKILMNLPTKTLAEIQEINDSVSPNFPIKEVIKLKKDISDINTNIKNTNIKNTN